MKVAEVGDLVRVDFGKYVCGDRGEADGIRWVYRMDLEEQRRMGGSYPDVSEALEKQKQSLKVFHSCFYSTGRTPEYTVISKKIISDLTYYKLSDRNGGFGWVIAEADYSSPFKSVRLDNGHPIN